MAVAVVEIETQREACRSSSRYMKPMLAREMLDVLLEVMLERWSGEQMNGAALQVWLQTEAHDLLRCQINVRGLATERFAREISSKLTVGVDGDHARVYAGETWMREVDEVFHAGPCRRCGYTVPIPWNHDEDDCNNKVVRDVIES